MSDEIERIGARIRAVNAPAARAAVDLDGSMRSLTVLLNRQRMEEELAATRLALLCRHQDDVDELFAEVERRWQLAVARAERSPRRCPTRAEVITSVARDVMEGVL